MSQATAAQPAPRAEERHGPRLARLWYGLLAGPIAWTIHLLGGYVLVGLACHTGAGVFLLGLHALALLALLATAAALVLAWRAWCASGEGLEIRAGGRHGRDAYLALAGVLLSTLFLATILVGAIQGLVLPACQ